MLLHFLLDEYASRYPGSTGFEDESAVEKVENKEEKEGGVNANKLKKTHSQRATTTNTATTTAASSFNRMLSRSSSAIFVT